MPDLKLYRTASTSSGQRISVGNTLAVDQEVTRDGTTLYQRKIFLAIPSDPDAHSISLKNKLMVGRFEKKLLTIRRTSSYLAESWKKKDDHVVVKFKRPWHLNRINTVNPSFVSLYRVDGDVKKIEVRTSTLSHHKDHITRLIGEKLSRLGDSYDTGFGIELVTLGAYFTEVVSHTQNNLNGKKDSGSLHDFQVLIDRYTNRFGSQNVGKFMPQESHIPERSEKLIPISGQNKTSRDWSSFLKNLQDAPHPIRPILLLPRPEPITAIAEVPDGPPVHFEWRRLKYRIIRAEGPERLASEWWRSADMAQEPTRDYFRVEDTDGGRFWLFRSGLYERKENPKWFMHGFFA